MQRGLSATEHCAEKALRRHSVSTRSSLRDRRLRRALEAQLRGVPGLHGGWGWRLVHRRHHECAPWPRWRYDTRRWVNIGATTSVVLLCSLSQPQQLRSSCSILLVRRQTWSMLPGALTAADATPAWNDMTLTLTSGACWETCRQLGKELVWWWPVDSYTVSVWSSPHVSAVHSD